MNDGGIKGQDTERCLLCGSVGDTLYSELGDRLYGVQGRWSIRRCTNTACGLAWLDPLPLESEQPRLYESYFTHAEDAGGGTQRIHGLRLLLRRAFNIVLRGISLFKDRRRASLMYLDTLAPGRLIELGCGDGARLAMFRRLGWQVTGQEVDEKAATHARAKFGVEVETKTVEELARSGPTFDAVIANHVIEHVRNPVAFIENCHRMLKPRGRLVMLTPNIDSHGHQVFGRSWIGLDPPRHFFLFSIVSLHKAAVAASLLQAQVTSTCANAQLFAIGSLEIRRHGHYAVGGHASIGTEVWAMVEQLAAFRFFHANPNSGEECVLIFDT